MRLYSKFMEDELFFNLILVLMFPVGFVFIKVNWEKSMNIGKRFAYIFFLKKTSSIIRNSNKTNKKYIVDRFCIL